MTIETADVSRMHETHENIVAICDFIWGSSPRCDWCTERLKYWTDEMERLGEGRIGIYRYIEDAAIAFQWAADDSDWTFGLELEWIPAIDNYAEQLLKTSPGMSGNDNDRRDALRWAALASLKATHKEDNPTMDSLVELAHLALADLEGMLPVVDPDGRRKHPGWKTVKELQEWLSAAGEDVD